MFMALLLQMFIPRGTAGASIDSCAFRQTIVRTGLPSVPGSTLDSCHEAKVVFCVQQLPVLQSVRLTLPLIIMACNDKRNHQVFVMRRDSTSTWLKAKRPCWTQTSGQCRTGMASTPFASWAYGFVTAPATKVQFLAPSTSALQDSKKVVIQRLCLIYVPLPLYSCL